MGAVPLAGAAAPLTLGQDVKLPRIPDIQGLHRDGGWLKDAK